MNPVAQGSGRPVGASLLAKGVNDGTVSLDERGALWIFASKLAPTKKPNAGGCDG